MKYDGVNEPSQGHHCTNYIDQTTILDIRKAREIMRKAFKDYPNFRETYVANIAKKMYYKLPDRSYKARLQSEDIARDIVSLIFEDE